MEMKPNQYEHRVEWKLSYWLDTLLCDSDVGEEEVGSTDSFCNKGTKERMLPFSIHSLLLLVLLLHYKSCTRPLRFMWEITRDRYIT